MITIMFWLIISIGMMLGEKRRVGTSLLMLCLISAIFLPCFFTDEIRADLIGASEIEESYDVGEFKLEPGEVEARYTFMIPPIPTRVCTFVTNVDEVTVERGDSPRVEFLKVTPFQFLFVPSVVQLIKMEEHPPKLIIPEDEASFTPPSTGDFEIWER